MIVVPISTLLLKLSHSFRAVPPVRAKAGAAQTIQDEKAYTAVARANST
jgi:hypothetical protein